MSESRAFHLGTLLTVTNGKMVSPNHIDGVRELVDFVTGESHMTHQLMRAADVVKAWLVPQLPWLGDVKVPTGLSSEEKVLTWLVKATAEYGAMHEVEAMPLGMYVGRDSMAEARELMPNAKFIPVDVDGPDHG